MDLNRVYGILLQLYPQDYQYQFQGEMRAAFRMSVEEHADSPLRVFVRFVLSEFAGLVSGAALDWFAKLTTDRSVRARYLPDLRMMPLPWVPSQSRAALLRKLRCSSDISR